jgi:hypothetical protein
MKPKILLIILFSLCPLHCAHYDSPDGGQNDSGIPDSGGGDSGADEETGDPGTDADLPPHPCRSHYDCLGDQRCLDGECLAEPPPCGENPAPGCAWSLEEEECRQNYGRYECSHIDYSWCWCNCQTGQAGCPCWATIHCRGDCMSEEHTLSNEVCQALKMGVCSEWTVNLGCYCIADIYGPGFNIICSD